MPNAKPEPDQPAQAADPSALRTLETEAGGIAALVAAIHGALAAAAVAAVELIARRRAG
jgi:hypothetical protein